MTQNLRGVFTLRHITPDSRGDKVKSSIGFGSFSAAIGVLLFALAVQARAEPVVTWTEAASGGGRLVVTGAGGDNLDRATGEVASLDLHNVFATDQGDSRVSFLLQRSGDSTTIIDNSSGRNVVYEHVSDLVFFITRKAHPRDYSIIFESDPLGPRTPFNWSIYNSRDETNVAQMFGSGANDLPLPSNWPGNISVSILSGTSEGDVDPTPEPATLTLFAIGLVGIAICRRLMHQRERSTSGCKA
jgi:hypothetical protein